GADIFTYIKARRDTPELGRYTMATNYRASTPMVQAVNSFFDKSHPFVFDQDIEFSPVSSSGNPDRNPLLVQGNAPSPFKVLLLNDETLASSPARGISKEMAGQASATWCAAEISRLLMAGQAGEALIGDEQLSSGHIAVLTRTHYEAETMRQALSKLGVASVYYSMESVYTTPEAAEMYQLLHALTQPGDSTAVRTGLVTVFFGYNGHDFDRFRSDQQEWEQLLNDVWEYHRIWNKHGFLAMFEQLIAEQRVVSRIMARADGERQLTNILHLAELLQEQNFQRPGMEELRRWLSEQIAAAESEQAGSAQQLRLESDENLIRIITIHKAKGLEYPVVFLPFIWSGRQPSPSDLNIFHDPDDLRCIIDMGSGVEENAALAAKERLAEDLRILYVALTRASYSCYICWGRVSGINHSAAAYLLHRDNEGNPINFPELNREVIRSDFALLNQDETLFEVLEQPAVHETGELKQVAVDDELRAREFTGSLNVEWRITSYSGLAGGQDHNDAMDEPKQAAPSVEDMGPSEHTFPRGPGAGLALHAIFENIDFSSATPEDLQKVVEEQLSIAGIGEQWRETAIQWITRVLDTDLDNSGQLRLRGLETRDRLNEMHFYFSLSSFDSNTFNRVLQQYDIPPLSGPDKRINGLMTGFIDLFFRHNNQYFIADYKSNHLGVSMDNYDRPSMERAMLEHRYDLQYLIYTLAIHRYLRTRIPDYDYDRDFGGVYYFFLRGMSPDSGADKGVYQVKPDLQLIEELDRCCGAEEAVTC
ncbi:MAG: hypothetical protein OEM02_10025, partial [Desulfobulbaceae bacterium]|nr:hypothetical protein [Desulfobulbaceae bacterium]